MCAKGDGGITFYSALTCDHIETGYASHVTDVVEMCENKGT